MRVYRVIGKQNNPSAWGGGRSQVVTAGLKESVALNPFTMGEFLEAPPATNEGYVIFQGREERLQAFLTEHLILGGI